MPHMYPRTTPDLGQSCKEKLEGTNPDSGQRSKESHALATGMMRNCRMSGSHSIYRTGFQRH